MSNFFKDIIDEPGKLEKEFLGPSYNYYDAIADPPSIGMGTKGDNLVKDVAGIIAYVEALITGQGEAVKKSLGNKFFLKTPGQCQDQKTKKNVDRYVYINNTPTGEIAIFPDMPDINLGSGFKGLIPGIVNDIENLNPLAIYRAFMEGEYPPCGEVKLPVIDSNGNTSSQSHFVAFSDLEELESSGQVPKGTLQKVKAEIAKEEASAKSGTKEGFVHFNNLKSGLLREATKVNKNKPGDVFQMMYKVAFFVAIGYLMFVCYKKMGKK